MLLTPWIVATIGFIFCFRLFFFKVTPSDSWSKHKHIVGSFCALVAGMSGWVIGSILAFFIGLVAAPFQHFEAVGKIHLSCFNTGTFLVVIKDPHWGTIYASEQLEGKPIVRAFNSDRVTILEESRETGVEVVFQKKLTRFWKYVAYPVCDSERFEFRVPAGSVTRIFPP